MNLSAIWAYGDSGLFWDREAAPEAEDEMIKSIAQRIHKAGMDTMALIMIESMKPLALALTHMGRLIISPFLPVFGKDITSKGEQFFQTFEKSKNMEKLIGVIEELIEEDKVQKNAEKANKLKKNKAEAEIGETSKNKGWRRFLPFW